MGKRVCIIVGCVLIAVLSARATFLAKKALEAENHTKHVKVFFFKCEAGSSHDAYVLSLYALMLLGLAHIVAIFVVAYDACTLEKASQCSKSTLMLFLVLFGLSGIGGMILLSKEMTSDNKSGEHCGVSFIHLTSYGWMFCAAHGVVSFAYLIVTWCFSTPEEKESGKGDERV
ncbi:hypothetical protein OROGR_015179 [Orobanche gracilis]